MNMIGFETFLSNAPADDYAFQRIPYEKQIQRAAKLIREAKHVLLGVGAGLSSAAGAVYGGTWFEEHFADFQQKYGKGPCMRDMYSAGFYPFPDEESYWGYWSKHSMLGGIEADFTSLHRTLLDALKGKDLFCISTNVDGQVVRAGLPEERIFCTQGDYFHIQCAKACHRKLYLAIERFRKMDAARTDCRIPTELVPKCPVCKGKMRMNLREDNYFVQDNAWYAAEERFVAFLNRALESEEELCLVELGVGFNTPVIIRFPFEKLVREHSNVTLVRLNLKEAFVPESFGDRAVGINADMGSSINDLSLALRR